MPSRVKVLNPMKLKGNSSAKQPARAQVRAYYTMGSLSSAKLKLYQIERFILPPDV